MTNPWAPRLKNFTCTVYRMVSDKEYNDEKLG